MTLSMVGVVVFATLGGIFSAILVSCNKRNECIYSGVAAICMYFLATMCAINIVHSRSTTDLNPPVEKQVIEDADTAGHKEETSGWVVTVTAEDGNEVYCYEGAVDVKDADSCVWFTGKDDKQYVVPYRATDKVEITRE